VAIFEGIHALNDIITGKNPAAMKLYISARSNVVDEGGKMVFKGTWMRLQRRTVRDAKFRSWEPEVTVKMWPNVRRGEKLYISPFKENATILFNSSLPYEVPVYATSVPDILREVPETCARREEVLEMRRAFSLFDPLDPSFVPAESLIREFIGGGIYRY
jgi:uridine kinase